MKTAQFAKKRHFKFRQSLFWDVDPKTIDPKKHAKYIIERILDFGNDLEVKWLWEHYDRKTIRDIARKSHGLQGQTKTLWALLTNKL